jgi:hypothetical protein
MGGGVESSCFLEISFPSLEIGEKGYKFERNYATSIFHFWENVKLQYNAGTKIGLEAQNVYAHKGTRVKPRKKGNESTTHSLFSVFICVR